MTNVLIVDDEKIEREGLKYLLSREEGKRTVFEAANGKQALQVLRSEDIQLLLTDIKMPHMTGLELSKKAKEENPNKPENIIEKMITGRLNKEMKEVCLLDQAYVQDSDLNVAQYVAKVGKEAGADLSVVKFVRFKTGEGIEK